jgi:tetratricopeptide (TPR) repeat protein
MVRDELAPAGKLDESITLLREEIKLNSTYTEAYFEMSHLFFRQNRLDSTLKYLQLSRERQPVDPMINNNLLLTFIQLNDYNGAKQQVNYMQQNGLAVDGGLAQQVEAIRR